MRVKQAALATLIALAIAACGGGAGGTRVQRSGGIAPIVPPAPSGPSVLSQANLQRPNLVMIMTDDQTVEDMRALPQVKQLIGGHGVTFENSFASWPLCCPSRATAFTGQYAHNHNVLGNYPPYGSSQAFTTDSESLAVWLQRAGYYTVHIGKYLNGYGHDNRGMTYVPPGWSDWYGTVDPSTYRMWGYTINHNGALRTYGDDKIEDPALYQTDVLRGIAINEVDQLAAGTQPFFLSLATLAPHEEIPESPEDTMEYPGPRPAPRHAGSFGKLPLPRPPNFDEAISGRKPPPVVAFASLFWDEPMARRTGRYRRRLEALRAVDEAVAAIVARLAALSLLDNTYILFTSDNGFFNGEHHISLGKYLMYEPSIRVPLLLRGPGIPPDQHSDELVANVDLAPTFVDLAGARAGRVMDGRSLMPYARDAALRSRRPVLLDAPMDQKLLVAARKGRLVDVPVMHGLRTPKLSYIEYATGDVELYNMVADPDQLNSLHNVPEFHDIEAAIRNALHRFQNCAGDSCRADINTPQESAPAARRATPPATPGRSPTRARRARAR